LILQNVQADLSVVVDVGMEHFGEESDLRGFVGVVFGEFEDEFEGAAFPGGVVGSEDDGLPEHNVGVHGGSGDSAGGIVLEPSEISQQATSGTGTHGGWRCRVE